ncbi:hypothetical protein HID58_095545, partial [Brassica napus]
MIVLLLVVLVRSMTAQVQGVIWIPDQLNDFKAYIAKLNSITEDEEKTRSIISNAVYIISAGNNDLGITFVSNPARNTRYTVFSYTNMMISWTQSFMQELYNLGARKFAIMGTLPLGCLPGASNAIGGICLEPANAVARLFNQKLANEVNNLNSVLPGSRSIYIDMYNPLLELVINPLRSGFTWSTWPCCCSPAAPVPCLDASRHVFWDTLLTQRRKLIKLLSLRLFNKSNKASLDVGVFVSAINLFYVL